ncbi:DNA mismatch repair enzyme (predicted ATPase) [Leptolyngbyaceae cyanobacterium JSC-12]|nr:DNA mismatch repair enzyme (predicted ATPase) [Leptolyngbyaceae cyanobacterium JSC-12]
MTFQKELNEKIPVVLTGHALQSLRDSGYSLPAALGEVIDNSLEANANNITLHFEESQTKSGKKHIHRITVIDDGDGMDLQTLQRYPQVGYSTRYMRTDTIGKYGVGAKLAAFNYGQRLDVWSRTTQDSPWYHVWFDLEEALKQEQNGEPVGIDFPDTQPLPKDISAYIPDASGTVVVWSKVDRLEEGRKAPDAQALKAEVQHELARMFRYFLNDGISIAIEDTQLLPHDPLYLMEGTWADQELSKYYARLRKREGKNGREDSLPLPPPSQKSFTAKRIAREVIKVGNSSCTLTVTLYPKEVIRRRGMGGDDLAEKLRLPDNAGAISFIRLNREINYTNVPRIFPRGVQDPDRFIGIEVSFSPELDSYFGVRNVKRGVEPYDELRTQIRELLKKHVTEARNLLDDIWGQVSQESNESLGEHQPILEAAKDANRTLPKSRVKTSIPEEEKEKVLADLAKDIVGDNKEKQEEYQKAIKDLPFVLESVDFPGNILIDTQHIDGQVIIRLNTRHRFYREMWEPLRSIATALPGSISGDEAAKAARRSIEALTLLIIAYGKAESMDENPREHFTDLRSDWGKFTESLMGKIKDII